jgi:glutamate 2,3-aminomutase
MNNYTEKEKKQIALNRAEELKDKIKDFLEASKKISTGLKLNEQINKNKQRILEYLNGTEKDWQDWQWQMSNRFRTSEALAEVINLSEEEIQEINKVSKAFRWSIDPYYVSLMDPNDPNCPIRKQAIPSIFELDDSISVVDDPMAEEFTSPAPCITRRYPDRLIIKVTNQCAMYCRHCQRRRNIGEIDAHKSIEELEEAIKYVADNPEIRDVLITGGDAFMLEDERLDWLLTKLDAIEHVEIKRFGTRTLATLPQRITDELCSILKRHHPVYVNTQFNHPKELTKESIDAAKKLTFAGVPLGNQSVLLNSINNDSHIIKKLNHELLKACIKPYYLFHAKAVTGTAHFITRVEEGIEIIEKLRGYTSGLAIPEYIVNAPGGYGKTPMQPEYVVSAGKDYIIIRTWEGRMIKYNNFA